MAAIKSQHSRILEQLVEKRRQDLIATLLAGVESFDTYKQLIGQSAGLDDALRLSEQADYEISGDGDAGA